MKNIKIVSLAACMTWMLSLMFFSSCSNDDSASASSGSAPAIEYVAPSGYNTDGSLKPLTPVRVGDPKNYYVIHGKGFLTTTKVYFNDFDTYFRPTFVTDTDIIILLDENTPYANASNKLKVVTQRGTALFDFVIKPPVPTFLQFYPINATAGQEVTITGKYFLNPVVTLAKTKTLPEVPVTVVSSTLEKVVIKLPENADLRYLTIANISGATTSTYAVGTAILDDVSYYGLGYPAPAYVKDEKAEQGTTYVTKDMDAWGSLEGNWGWFDKLAPYSGIRVAIKAKAEGKVRLVFNGDWTNSPVVSVTTEWKTFYLPWSMFSSSDRVQNITFQNLTATAKGDGLPNTFYIDNIGFMLKAE
ncbi:hypothetical protein CLU81_1373 [Flavobacterium sp. 9]|uniref:hypothetical protein n=1 Tax=Flavobacterium sp. 9 TaxID=2035198 RepID=UPI000C18C314|nr:hypothetical protein [Flavobacterium sp. 9]PIF30917.1 hypothetical protein CLU81_1373 [Flavobacterium sp. 9]